IDHESLWRFLVVFANRTTANEWWRAVTNSVATGYGRIETAKCISPQFCTFNPDVNGSDISKTLTD
ncbi:hypothetical protein AX14_007271, partial [Amanita brunnescens Koide BX004]